MHAWSLWQFFYGMTNIRAWNYGVKLDNESDLFWATITNNENIPERGNSRQFLGGNNGGGMFSLYVCWVRKRELFGGERTKLSCYSFWGGGFLRRKWTIPKEKKVCWSFFKESLRLPSRWIESRIKDETESLENFVWRNKTKEGLREWKQKMRTQTKVRERKIYKWLYNLSNE